MSGEQALDGIENLDYEAWDYKPGVADRAAISASPKTCES